MQYKENDVFAHSYLLCRFDSCFLIDPSHDYEIIKRDLAGRKLIGLLLTHAHYDHIDIIGEFDVPIYLHFSDAHLLFEDSRNGYAPLRHPYKKKELELRYVSHGMKINFADQFIEVLHTPGHTKGSVSYLYNQKLYSGDTLFKGSVGRHDLYSGSLVSLKKSVLLLCSLPANTKVYPGHGEKTTIRNEQKNNQFYLKWLKQFSKK